MVLLLMFERVFNRLGHGSVVEKNRGRRRGRRRRRIETRECARRKVAVFLFVCFRFKLRNRVINWEGWGILREWER